VSISRLASAAPDLEEALDASSRTLRLGVAAHIARWAAERVGWSRPSGPGSLAAITEDLDERYFALQELREQGRCSKAEVSLAFSLARAASSAAFADQGEASEAIYEAISATDDLPGVREAVSSFLAGSSSIV
jgi:hypothetical protein